MEKISNLLIGDLFSFSEKGAVHMATRINNHLEYKSYSDGKIRIYYNTEKKVFLRPNWNNIFELKWFNAL